MKSVVDTTKTREIRKEERAIAAFSSRAHPFLNEYNRSMRRAKQARPIFAFYFGIQQKDH